MERSSISLSVTITTYYTAKTVFAFVNNSMTLYDVLPLEVYRAKPMPTYYSKAYSHRRYLRLLRLVNNIHLNVIDGMTFLQISCFLISQLSCTLWTWVYWKILYKYLSCVSPACTVLHTVTPIHIVPVKEKLLLSRYRD